MADEQQTWGSADKEDTPNYVVTLVHGTFAPRAPVDEGGIALGKVLASRLGASATVFAPFTWSGGNSHLDRIRAGLAFRSFFREGLKEYPKSRHVIIAHSHGGNVVLYGLRQARRRERQNLGAIIWSRLSLHPH